MIFFNQTLRNLRRRKVKKIFYINFSLLINISVTLLSNRWEKWARNLFCPLNMVGTKLKTSCIRIKEFEITAN